MEELFKIVLTASITVLGGITVYAIGQIILRNIIKPLQEQREVLGKIAHSLIFYANVYANPGTHPKKKLDEAAEAFRDLSASLMAKTYVVRGYWIFARSKDAPRKENVVAAHKELIGLSNSIHKGDPGKNQARRERIELLLGISQKSSEDDKATGQTDSTKVGSKQGADHILTVISVLAGVVFGILIALVVDVSPPLIVFNYPGDNSFLEAEEANFLSATFQDVGTFQINQMDSNIVLFDSSGRNLPLNNRRWNGNQLILDVNTLLEPGKYMVAIVARDTSIFHPNEMRKDILFTVVEKPRLFVEARPLKYSEGVREGLLDGGYWKEDYVRLHIVVRGENNVPLSNLSAEATVEGTVFWFSLSKYSKTICSGNADEVYIKRPDTEFEKIDPVEIDPSTFDKEVSFSSSGGNWAKFYSNTLSLHPFAANVYYVPSEIWTSRTPGLRINYSWLKGNAFKNESQFYPLSELEYIN